MTTGAARTMAHGQAITSITSALYAQSSAGPMPSRGGTAATRMAAQRTAGVYTAANRSMNVWTGAFSACASSTRRRIRA